MRKKFIAGAAVLALLMNAPQVKAEDNIVVFGGEFDDNKTPPARVQKPEPIRDLPPVEEPAPIEEPEPVEEPPEEIPLEPIEPPDIPPVQDVQQEPEPISQEPSEDDDNNFGDDLIFDDLNQTPIENPNPKPQVIEKPTKEPLQPAQVEEPFNEPAPVEENVIDPVEPIETERPFERPNGISNDAPVVVVPPQPQPPLLEVTPYQSPEVTVQEPPVRRRLTPRRIQPRQDLKVLPMRFVKLAVDDTYTYYLDKNSVQWIKMPYSTSEYIADVWIRMVEREPQDLDEDMRSYGAENFSAEVSLAEEQGYRYSPEDMQVLSSQGYVLEHYYLRPKTRQIQFLCELEVFGRPQNTISERNYDYKNWENLVPGSVESVIYEATIKIIGKYKSTERGHMTFIDMLEEYGRISLR